MSVSFTLKVYIYGRIDAIINKYMYFDGEELSCHLRTAIEDEVNEKKTGNRIGTDDYKIRSITGTGGVDLS